jgi:hypothetical protein
MYPFLRKFQLLATWPSVKLRLLPQQLLQPKLAPVMPSALPRLQRKIWLMRLWTEEFHSFWKLLSTIVGSAVLEANYYVLKDSYAVADCHTGPALTGVVINNSCYCYWAGAAGGAPQKSLLTFSNQMDPTTVGKLVNNFQLNMKYWPRRLGIKVFLRARNWIVRSGFLIKNSSLMLIMIAIIKKDSICKEL